MSNVAQSFSRRDLDAAFTVYAKNLGLLSQDWRTSRTIIVPLDNSDFATVHIILEPLPTPEQSKVKYKAFCRYALWNSKTSAIDLESGLSESILVIFRVFYHIDCYVVLEPVKGHHWGSDGGSTNPQGSQREDSTNSTVDHSEYGAIAFRKESPRTLSKVISTAAGLEDKSQSCRIHPDNIVG